VILSHRKTTTATTRRLKRELTDELAKLHGLVGVWSLPVVGQHSVDGTLDEESSKELAGQIRDQAEICLNLLDQYQSSVPGPAWSYAERKCVPLRADLKQTEMFFRAASGEWEGRFGQKASGAASSSD
jgi:hypothetical protein